VFDQNGKEKTIIGRPGQGPGEFGSIDNISISDDGLITVLDNTGFNLFAANYKFIRKIRYRNLPLYANYKKENDFISLFSPNDVYSLNDSERVVRIAARKELKDDRNLVEVMALVYENADTLIELAEYAPDNIRGLREMAWIAIPGATSMRTVYGEGFYDLFAVLLPNKHVAFMHTFYDAKEENNEFAYTINIVNLANLQKSQITKSYEPFDIKKELSSGRYNEANEKFLKANLEVRKYFPPLSSLLYDRKLLFAVHDVGPVGKYNLKEGESFEVLTDIFDVETFTYLRSAYFPDTPEIIKNGYAYNIGVNEDGFIVLEKYKIDPAVYGK